MIIGSNFILLNSLITILTGYLIKGLENSITKAQKHMEEISLTQEVTIEGLSTIVEYRDPETGGHILRTQNYVKVLATHLKNTPKYFGKIDQEYIDLLYKSSPLHDIGKVAVPDYILLKTSQLTKSEFEQMKKHTTYGRNALLNVEQKLGDNNFLRYAREMAYSHHEKWDGSGYPLGLQGDNIPLSGRIMAIADVYDALISRRVYKAPLPHETAVDLIKENRGMHF
ncbi:HD domain-containing protein, partial [bacterium]|nr:HD domain-containing protein [bacterium]